MLFIVENLSKSDFVWSEKLVSIYKYLSFSLIWPEMKVSVKLILEVSTLRSLSSVAGSWNLYDLPVLQ